MEKKNPPAVLPIQIAYYAGLRIGEVCGLTWQNINLEEQYLTVKRSVRYDGSKHKTIIGPTKRKKVRTVDFDDTLTAILKKARKQQLKNQMQYRSSNIQQKNIVAEKQKPVYTLHFRKDMSMK